jgi:hypothetical protein
MGILNRLSEAEPSPAVQLGIETHRLRTAVADVV